MSPASVTFERAGLAVTATYLGARQWTVRASTPDSTTDARFDNDFVATEIRNALQPAEPLPSGTRIEIRAEHTRHGVIANNTFPPTAWWFNIDPGAGSVAADLDAAIWECLEALRLSPAGAATPRSPLVDPSFGVDALGAASDTWKWASELARRAQEWLGVDAVLDDALDFMRQLRALGHPLYSFDESDDFVTWSTWGKDRPRRRLQVQISLPAYETPVVAVTVWDSDA